MPIKEVDASPEDEKVVEIAWEAGRLGVGPNTILGKYIEALLDEWTLHVNNKPNKFSDFKLEKILLMLNPQTVAANNRGNLTENLLRNLL